MDGHALHGTRAPRRLEEISDEMHRSCDTYALEMGRLLQEGRERSTRRYRAWTDGQTPFTVAEAERLRAVYLAHRELPADEVAALPRPSMALTHTFTPTSPNLSQSPTRDLSEADLIAGALVSTVRDELSTEALDLLRGWIGDL